MTTLNTIIEPGYANKTLATLSMPKFSPEDYYKVQDSINVLLEDFKDLLPAMSEEQKDQLIKIIDKPSINRDSVSVDDVVAQYRLVIKIRNKLIRPNDELADEATARDLTSFTNAVGNLLNVYMRNESKFNQMREIAETREAIQYALAEQSDEVKRRFLERLRGLQGG
jgi:hypothetical protein